MIPSARILLTSVFVLAPFLSASGQASSSKCSADGWLEKSDAAFAADCAQMAFSDSLKDRQTVAWMFFVRVNQLIDDPTNGGMSNSDKVPAWMAWPTDPDTFATRMPFDFDSAPRTIMKPSTEKKDLEAGQISTEDPDGANEEVTRNKISYDYLVNSGLTTKRDVAAFFADNDYVDMPVGSIELKASWLQVTDGSPVPTHSTFGARRSHRQRPRWPPIHSTPSLPSTIACTAPTSSFSATKRPSTGPRAKPRLVPTQSTPRASTMRQLTSALGRPCAGVKTSKARPSNRFNPA